MGQLFNDILSSLGKEELHWVNDTVKCALYTTAPDIDADTFLSDITGEATGSGYTAGGKTLTNKTVTTDDTNNRSIYDADDVQWTALTTSFRYIVIYLDTGVAATSRLIATHDLGSTQIITNGTYDITWPTSGVFNIANS